MEERLNHIEQKDKMKNIVVSGIPKQEEEVSETMKKLFKAMKVQINDGDVLETFRLNSNEDAPILLKLKNMEEKNTLMSKIRDLKGIKLNECGLSGGNKSIYFNEDLTRQNQLLFKKARELKKEKKYNKAYVSNGKIYLKKNENDRPIRITSTMLPVWGILILLLLQCDGLSSDNCGFNSMCTCTPGQHDQGTRTIHGVSCISVPFYKFPTMLSLGYIP
ncbi:unnamed protein product [Phaedon cochleariae]|uniref:FP protein C-terminal domain-containing protein n=1 Tax=Phaedon cochleariae TaxID=80249 RepID=A0A9N9WYS4_PHACE|nr:unnamed protein product [Phaedon cochleariae]